MGILLHLLAAALYAALGVYFWRSRQAKGPAVAQQQTLRTWERTILLAPLTIHGAAIYHALFPGSGMQFGVGYALSLMLWLAMVLYWIESLFARLEGLQILALPVAAVCALLPVLLPGQHLLLNADSLVFRAHFLIAMLAYSLFTLAALHALLMAAAEKHLHRGKLSGVLSGLPPLLTMETLLFRLIGIAFVLLTLTLGTGIVFSEELFGKAFRVDHKTVFAVISWGLFGALLIGRHWRGWRGRLALRWTLAGFVTLLLAYVGSRFVLEVILGRA